MDDCQREIQGFAGGRAGDELSPGDGLFSYSFADSSSSW